MMINLSNLEADVLCSLLSYHLEGRGENVDNLQAVRDKLIRAGAKGVGVLDVEYPYNRAVHLKPGPVESLFD